MHGLLALLASLPQPPHLQACHSGPYIRGPGAATSPGWKQQGPRSAPSCCPHLTHCRPSTSCPAARCCCCCCCWVLPCCRPLGEGLLLRALLGLLLLLPPTFGSCCHCCHCCLSGEGTRPDAGAGFQGGRTSAPSILQLGVALLPGATLALLQVLLQLMSCNAGRHVSATLVLANAAATSAFAGASPGLL